MNKSARTITWNLLFLLLVGCEQTTSGMKLRKQSFQFPTGIAVHPQGFALVVSSNFDLGYENGTVQAIDLVQLAVRVASGKGLSSENHHTDLILEGSAIGISNFGGLLQISQDGSLAALTVRGSNELVLLDLSVVPDPNEEDLTNLKVSCWPTNKRPADRLFPFCEGSRHVVKLDYDDPYGIFLYDDPNGQEGDLIAYVTYLTNKAIQPVLVPERESDREGESPYVLPYELNTTVAGTNDMVMSPYSDLAYVTSRFTGYHSNPIHYFDPVLGSNASMKAVELFPDYLGVETRGMDFLEDGVGNIAVLLVKNPDMVLFLDTTLGKDGLPQHLFLGQVSVGNNPSRIRAYNNIVLVTCTQDDAVYIIDVPFQRLLDVREDICRGPFDLDFYDDERLGVHWALVSCFEDNMIAVVDVDSNSATYLEVVAFVGERKEGD